MATKKDVDPTPRTPPQPGLGDPGEGPSSADGTLASGYSSGSASGGTPGGVLQPRGSGYSPGADSRIGAHPNEGGDLPRAGVAAGAAGVADEDRAAKRRGGEPRAADGDREDYDATEGGRAVGGVSGTSGGGSGTTPANNTRK